jgi:hypothetical protein
VDEVWVRIPDFENYEVSNLGRVRNGNKILKPYPTKGGYLDLQLYKNKKSHHKLVHVLVAEAFIGPKPIGLEVCHENGHGTDN